MCLYSKFWTILKHVRSLHLQKATRKHDRQQSKVFDLMDARKNAHGKSEQTRQQSLIPGGNFLWWNFQHRTYEEIHAYIHIYIYIHSYIEYNSIRGDVSFYKNKYKYIYIYISIYRAHTNVEVFNYSTFAADFQCSRERARWLLAWFAFRKSSSAEKVFVWAACTCACSYISNVSFWISSKKCFGGLHGDAPALIFLKYLDAPAGFCYIQNNHATHTDLKTTCFCMSFLLWTAANRHCGDRYQSFARNVYTV